MEKFIFVVKTTDGEYLLKNIGPKNKIPNVIAKLSDVSDIVAACFVNVTNPKNSYELFIDGTLKEIDATYTDYYTQIINKSNFSLKIRLTSKILLELPTMIYNNNDNVDIVKFLIPCYVDNNDKFYPSGFDVLNADYEFSDYGFLTISRYKLKDLRTKGKTTVDGFVGKYSDKDELKNYIEQEKVEIILLD